MKLNVKNLLPSMILGGLLLFGTPNLAAAQDVYSYTASNGVRVYVDTDSIEWITLNDTTFNIDVHLSNGVKDSLHYWVCQEFCVNFLEIFVIFFHQWAQPFIDEQLVPDHCPIGQAV